MGTADGHLLGRWRLVAERPLLLDLVLALVLGAAVLKAALSDSADRAAGWDVLIAVVAFVAVLGRRRRPLLALGIATTATAAAVVQEVRNPGLIVALGVITYSIAAHTDRRRGWSCAVAASSVVYLTVALLNRDSWFRADVLGIFAWVFLAAAVGDAARSHRAYVREVEERARRAEQNREEEARRRVTEERLRIARELHDVVAHHIAVISVQAGAAAHVLDRRPEQVAPVLAHIREASDTVLQEIQSVVGVLRAADEPAGTEPLPGLDRLPELVDGLAAAAFPVEFRQEGEPRALPAVADLAAYRIAQEALTNAHKHGVGRARLTVDFRSDAVEIEVVNAVPPGPARRGSGYGLLGMHERATAAGGTFTAGTTSGEFRVRAVLPVDEPAPAPAPAPDPVPDAGPECGVRPWTRAKPARVVRELQDAVTELHAQAHALTRAEIDFVVRGLRGRGEPAGPPGLPELLTELSGAGFAVELREDGEPRALPPAAFRIAEEALRNAHRNGVGAARLTVRYRPDAVEVEVTGTAGGGLRVHAVLPDGAPEPPPAPAPEYGGRSRGRVRPA